MTVWTAPGSVHTGTSNLTPGTADWYNQPSEEAADEVVVDNLDHAPHRGPRAWCWAAYCSGLADERVVPTTDCIDPQDCPYPHTTPTSPLGEGGVSVESSAHHDTKELGLENSLPQTSLRNKPDVIEVASLRYFTDAGTRYWTLHTDLERLDRHQLVALAELVRAEQAKRK